MTTNTGHNSVRSIAKEQIRQIVERVERLDDEAKEIAEGRKEVYAEAKGNGFDVKTLKKIVALRKRSADDLDEEQAMLDLYMTAFETSGRSQNANEVPA